MADISDVEQSLVAAVAQAVYPLGTGQPSVLGTPVKIYRGWPIPASLDTDLAAGIANISVFPLAVETNTTRHLNFQDWVTLTLPTVTLDATVADNTVMIAGAVSTPQNVAVKVNKRHGYAYAVQANDTPTTIATALAALIAADYPGTANTGPVITIPGATFLGALAGGVGSVMREVKRQKRSFQISLWCATPTQRDALGSAIDPVLAATEFLTLADGSGGWLRYERTFVNDAPEKVMLYRRDLVYSVDYATTQVQSAVEILIVDTRVNGGLDPSNPPIFSIVE